MTSLIRQFVFKAWPSTSKKRACHTSDFTLPKWLLCFAVYLAAVGGASLSCIVRERVLSRGQTHLGHHALHWNCDSWCRHAPVLELDCTDDFVAWPLWRVICCL